MRSAILWVLWGMILLGNLSSYFFTGKPSPALLIGFFLMPWVFRDAKERGLSYGRAWAWAIAVLIFSVFALLAYLLARPRISKTL